MEFIISRNVLMDALNKAWRVIDTRTSNPILKEIVFDFPKEQQRMMTVKAGNYNEWIEVDCPLEDAAGDIRALSVFYSDIIAPIRTLDDQPLRIEVGEYQMTVCHETGAFRLPVTNHAEEHLSYSRPDPHAEAQDGKQLEYEAPGLRSILKRSSFAIVYNELRPVMNGVFFNLTRQYADYVSSDGHRLVRVRKSAMTVNGTNVETSFVMPKRVVDILLKTLPKTGDVTLEYQKEKTRKELRKNWDGTTMEESVVVRKAAARIVIDDSIRLSFYPIDGVYPNYLNVINTEHLYETTVDRRKFLKSVNRLSLFSDSMKMTIRQDEMALRAQDKHFSLQGDERLGCETCKVDGKSWSDCKIRLGLMTTSSTLKALDSEEIVMHVADSSRPVLFYPKPQPDVEDVLMLLMPILGDE